MTTEFKVNETDKIVATTQSTRSGFRHVVKYYHRNNEVASKSVGYLNRTWERWEYETAINNLLDKMGKSDAEKKTIHDIVEKQALGQVDSMFKSVANVAMLGEIFGQTKKEKNDWKARMLKAGLGNSGLEMPEDWDTLSEDEKERRLDSVIKMMKAQDSKLDIAVQKNRQYRAKNPSSWGKHNPQKLPASLKSNVGQGGYFIHRKEHSVNRREAYKKRGRK